MTLRTLLILTLAAAAIAGCGRKGPLQPPQARTVQTEADTALPLAVAAQPAETTPGSAALVDLETAGRSSANSDQRSAGAQEPARAVAAPGTANRRFFLDPLL